MKMFSAVAVLLLFLTGCARNTVRQYSSQRNPPRTKVPDTTAVRHIYITFDDGPLEGSEDIDNVIRREKIDADVFIVGQHALHSPKMANYYHMYQEDPYIEIANHSFTHANNHYKLFYSHPSTDVADFGRCEQDLHIPTRIARLPGRNQWRLKDVYHDDVSTGSACADMLYGEGYKVFGWDIEWQHDPRTGRPLQSVDQMVALIDRTFRENRTIKPDNLVLLAHDEMFRDGSEEKELQELIDKLKAKGNYRFDHLSSYPG